MKVSTRFYFSSHTNASLPSPQTRYSAVTGKAEEASAQQVLKSMQGLSLERTQMRNSGVEQWRMRVAQKKQERAEERLNAVSA